MGLASLYELQTLYSYQDLLELIDIIQVDSYNVWQEIEAHKGEYV